MTKFLYILIIHTLHLCGAHQVISHQPLEAIINDPKHLIVQSNTTALSIFDVVIFNDTGLLLSVSDKVILLNGKKDIINYQLKPSEQTPQKYVHRSIDHCIDRSIEIKGSMLTGDQKTTPLLIIGNNQSAAVRPKGRSISGVYSITQDPRKQLSLSATQEKEVSDAGAVVFSRSLQLWDTTIRNSTPHILYIIDLIDGPQLKHVHQFVVQPAQSVILAWDRSFTAQRVRKIIIWGPSLSSSKPSNKIIISNTLDSTYLTPGGSPGGIYTIIPDTTKGNIVIQNNR